MRRVFRDKGLGAMSLSVQVEKEAFLIEQGVFGSSFGTFENDPYAAHVLLAASNKAAAETSAVIPR